MRILGQRDWRSRDFRYDRFVRTLDEGGPTRHSNQAQPAVRRIEHVLFQRRDSSQRKGRFMKRALTTLLIAVDRHPAGRLRRLQCHRRLRRRDAGGCVPEP